MDAARPEVLGIDVGGVIISRTNDNTDTSFFSDNYLNTRMVEGAVETITDLVARRFGQRVYIVSKCGPRTEAKTREYFAHHRIFERTGIPADHIRFCRMRKDKAPICAELGITHFIDDRLEVLAYLATVPHLFLFQPQDAEIARHAAHLARVQRVTSWAEVRRALLPV